MFQVLVPGFFSARLTAYFSIAGRYFFSPVDSKNSASRLPLIPPPGPPCFRINAAVSSTIFFDFLHLNGYIGP